MCTAAEVQQATQDVRVTLSEVEAGFKRTGGEIEGKERELRALREWYEREREEASRSTELNLYCGTSKKTTNDEPQN